MFGGASEPNETGTWSAGLPVRFAVSRATVVVAANVVSPAFDQHMVRQYVF